VIDKLGGGVSFYRWDGGIATKYCYVESHLDNF
jgi:hypothetical protein